MKAVLMAFLLAIAAPAVAVQSATGSVKGLVIGRDGKPAQKMPVAALPVNGPKDGSPWGVAGAVEVATDDTGQYQIDKLPSGRYLIGVSAPMPFFYPGAGSKDEATAVTVAPGMTVNEIDIRLPGPGSAGTRVSGRVIRPAGQAAQGTITVRLNGPGSNTTEISESTPPKQKPANPDGTFEFTDVKPGSYTLAMFPTQQLQPLLVVVGNEDVPELEIVLPVSVEVRGAVKVEGGGVIPSLSLTFIGFEGGSTSAQVTASSGAFNTQLNEGAYRVIWNDIPRGYMVKSIQRGTDDLLTAPLKIASRESQPIVVTLGVAGTPPWVKVSGRLTGLPAAASRGSTTAPSRINLSRDVSGETLRIPPTNPPAAAIAADGSFEFPMVPAGAYRVAVTPLQPGVTLPPIVVAGKDLTNLRFALPASREIAGRITVEGGNAPIPQVMLSLTGLTFGSQLSTFSPTIRPDGAFKITLPETDLRLGFVEAALPAGYTLKSYTYGTTDLLKDPIKISALGGEIRLTFTVAPNNFFRLSGTVTGLSSLQRTATSPAVTVTLSGSAINRLIGTFTVPVGPDGKFEVAKVPNGEYTVRLVATPPPANAVTTTVTVEKKDLTGVQLTIPAQKPR